MNNEITSAIKIKFVAKSQLQQLKIAIYFDSLQQHDGIRFGWTGSILHASRFVYEYVEAHDGGQRPENSG